MRTSTRWPRSRRGIDQETTCEVAGVVVGVSRIRVGDGLLEPAVVDPAAIDPAAVAAGLLAGGALHPAPAVPSTATAASPAAAARAIGVTTQG
jgi:hypothetical protein